MSIDINKTIIYFCLIVDKTSKTFWSNIFLIEPFFDQKHVWWNPVHPTHPSHPAGLDKKNVFCDQNNLWSKHKENHDCSKNVKTCFDQTHLLNKQMTQFI